MVWHYQATIVNLRLTDMATNCLDGFGKIKNPAAKRAIIQQIRSDLVEIMQKVVSASTAYFGRGRTGTMNSSLKRGIQVKGMTAVSLRAILSGVEYTLTHENDTYLKPRHAKMLAIPLKAACRADGTPIFQGGPTLWKGHKKTFVLSGDRAVKAGREPKDSQINPHDTSEIAYIVYKDKTQGHNKLVYLYKLVPYSIFKEGYKNYRGRKQLKKLGLEKRLYTALSYAWAGWYNYILKVLSDFHDMEGLKAYTDINFKREVVTPTKTWYIPTGSTRNLPKVVMNAAGFVNMAIKANEV